MEHLSKFLQQLQRFCEKITLDLTNLYDPKNILILGVTFVVTVLSILIAWRLTRPGKIETPKKTNLSDHSDEQNVIDRKKEFDTEEVNVVEQDGDTEPGDIVNSPSPGCPITWPCGPDDLAKLPAACPLSHMYHISKMSKLAESQSQGEQNDEENKEEVSKPYTLDTDPQEYISHIQSQVKKSQQKATMKKIEAEMDEDAKAREREIQRTQLEAIYKLMETQKEKFGISDVDEMQSQIKLYM